MKTVQLRHLEPRRKLGTSTSQTSVWRGKTRQQGSLKYHQTAEEVRSKDRDRNLAGKAENSLKNRAKPCKPGSPPKVLQLGTVKAGKHPEVRNKALLNLPSRKQQLVTYSASTSSPASSSRKNNGQQVAWRGWKWKQQLKVDRRG
ncbi:hypothetical protein Salat_2125400 [Sesamum alatum]|uniref:Uncharacterized protein n=1 Tax=Sesamum alatum TaxID=300844 RepID=A0AAE1Y103_9LAMI|nr:hypothetical protein Salat_2125400 [Sesamum alatum]